MMMQSAVDFSDYELIISLDFTIFAKLFVWIVSFLYFCSILLLFGFHKQSER